MGLRGPIPIEDAQRKRTGEARPSAQKDDTVTRTKCEAPRIPSWFSGHAMTCWKHVVPLLIEQGTIAKADRNALIRYCLTYAKWREVALKFMDSEASLTDKDGIERKSPLFQIYRDLGAMLAQLEQEFGLTPKARMRLAPTKDDIDDPYASILDNRSALG